MLVIIHVQHTKTVQKFCTFSIIYSYNFILFFYVSFFLHLYEWCVPNLPLAPFSLFSIIIFLPKNLSPPFSPFTATTSSPPTQAFRSVVKKSEKKMNRCGYQQTGFVGCVGVGEMRRGDISVSDGVVCPKPRRTGLFNSSYVHANEPIRPSRFLQINNQTPEACDLKAGTELLDIILSKGNYDMETPKFDMASSPPFFFGSPPSRASNPLIQDSQFSNNNFVPILAIPEGAVAGSAAPSPPQPSASARKSGGGCGPVKFGIKPATVRIEGFNCRSSISAVA